MARHRTSSIEFKRRVVEPSGTPSIGPEDATDSGVWMLNTVTTDGLTCSIKSAIPLPPEAVPATDVQTITPRANALAPARTRTCRRVDMSMLLMTSIISTSRPRQPGPLIPTMAADPVLNLVPRLKKVNVH